MRWTAIPLSLIVFGLLYLFFGRDTFRPDPTPPAKAALTVAPPAAEPVINRDMSPGSPKRCLSETELESHPSLLAEAELLDQVLAGASELQRYRSLNEEGLLALAEQGDSGAMAALGAHYVMVAQGHDAKPATDSFDPDNEEYQTLRLPMRRNYTEDQKEAFSVAMHWYFQSAVHGRYMALQELGLVSYRRFGSAVDHGWITREDYDALDYREQAALFPVNVYQQAGIMLIPGSGGGVSLQRLLKLNVTGTRQSEISAEIASSVTNAQNELGVTPTHVDVSNLLSEPKLQELLCEEDKTRIREREAGT